MSPMSLLRYGWDGRHERGVFRFPYPYYAREGAFDAGKPRRTVNTLMRVKDDSC